MAVGSMTLSIMLYRKHAKLANGAASILEGEAWYA
jgi:hypothetical protein